MYFRAAAIRGRWKPGAAQCRKTSVNSPVRGFATIQRNDLDVPETEMAVERACSPMMRHAAPPRRVARDVREEEVTHIGLSAPPFGPPRQAGKTYSSRQKFKRAYVLSSVREVSIPFAVHFASGSSHACPFFGVVATCCAGRNSAFHFPSKTAARRPHRWILLTETKRLVETPSCGDAPFRSYSTMKSPRRGVVTSVANPNTGSWTDTLAVGVIAADSPRIGCVSALEAYTAAQLTVMRQPNSVCARLAETIRSNF